MNSMDALPSAPTPAALLRCAASDLDVGGPWLFWSAPPSPTLRRSLERQGQLVPVLVDASGPRPALVAGSARVSALAELGREVLCLDLGATDGLTRGIVYAHSNAGRETGDGQVVLAMRYFQTLPDVDEDSVLGALGLEPRSKRLRLVRAWLSLPAKWDAFLCAGAVPLACADLLEAFPCADRESLEGLFTTLSWSRGNAVNVLTWIREICLRDGACAAEVLDGAGVKDILAGGLSPKDAMSRITQEVRLLRYPALSGMERDFQDAARAIAGGTRWRVTQPDLFESDAVELSVRLTSPAELRAASLELARIAACENLDTLFPAGGK